MRGGNLLIWQCFSPIWQACFEEAWSAYCHGSLPHGAVVVDAHGQIVSRGRNRIREKSAEGREFAGNRLAHAELNALLALDWSAVDIYGCQLYATIEPCPMCFGAVRMTHMQSLHYAVRDGGVGATSLTERPPYFQQNKDIEVFAPTDSEMELVLMALQVESTLSQGHPKPWEWINLLAKDLPRAVTVGSRLFEEHQVVQWKEENRDAAFVLDQIHERLLLSL